MRVEGRRATLGRGFWEVVWLLPASLLLDWSSLLVDFMATRQNLGPGVTASCRASCHQEGGRTVCPEQAGARLAVQAPGLAFRGTQATAEPKFLLETLAPFNM